MSDLTIIRYKIHSLVLFRGILEDDVFKKFTVLLESMNLKDTTAALSAYADFAGSLVPHNFDFGKYLLNYVLDNENPYIKKAARQEEIHYMLEECLKNDLSILQDVASVTSYDIKKYLDIPIFLPDWHSEPCDFLVTYQREYANLTTQGYGVFRKSHMFTYKKGKLVPARYPDPITLDELTGYEYERGLVLKNTEGLLLGKPAANILLYGDSGTGKSSTIKAVVNALKGRGLRLVELRKDQLTELHNVIAMLGSVPMKFILYIDDLSFERQDDDYAQLKAMLEGSVLSRTKNVVVYATSNRRHLVRETFSERQGDDVHVNETLQQTVSLSERFGLAIPFTAPSRDLYLEIVDSLATAYGVKADKKALAKQAEAYAIAKGGRSGRIARQFIEQYIALGL